MAPLVVDPCGYLKPHHSVGHCRTRSQLGGSPGSMLSSSDSTDRSPPLHPVSTN